MTTNDFAGIKNISSVNLQVDWRGEMNVGFCGEFQPPLVALNKGDDALIGEDNTCTRTASE